MTQIPVFKPLLAAEELEAARAALELGWLGMGSYVGQFEEALKTLCGAEGRHVAAVSTGHAALHLALLLAGCGPGDEVITPSFNNIADMQAILATGAKPVFCDVLDETLCLDLDSAERLIGPRTKVLIAMDYACHVCDHDRVAEIARRHDIRVIHDAAHAVGSTYKGRPIGSFADMTVFSFDPIKTITSLDGGAVIVRSEEELRQLHEMRLIGMKQATQTLYGNNRAWSYDVERLGFRYHLANLHAALGLAQLAKFDIIASTRRALFRQYQDAFSPIAGLRVPGGDMEGIVPFIFYLRVLDGRREAFRTFLAANGVDTGIHWQPAHGFSLFKDCRKDELPVTERMGREIVTIPFHSCMAPEAAEKVVDTVTRFFAAPAKP
ncbi:MAG: DegT/DnrJ/EryC1/StrS family aminotransferase [Pseudomonadota bacterium]